MLLVKYNDNWADEMDLSGFCLMTKEQYHEMMEAAEKIINHQGSYIYYVGTNEEVEYDKMSRFEQAFTTTTVTAAEAKVISSFLEPCFGFFPDPVSELEDLDIEEDEDK